MQDTEAGTVDEDWDVLLSFLPRDWRELAQDTGALKGLRKDKAVDNLLRTPPAAPRPSASTRTQAASARRSSEPTDRRPLGTRL